MNTATLESRTVTPVPAAQAAPRLDRPDRLDLYQPIHKALRALMADTLVRLGALDVGDAAEIEQTLGQTETLLTLVEQHLLHEDTFVHPVLRGCAPQGATQTEHEHDEHRASIQALRGEVRALRADPHDAAALRLYRHAALFVAENLSHMHFEETVLNAALWARLSDEELHAVHARLLAHIPAEEMDRVLRWMVPAMTPTQRIGFFTGLQQAAPPEAVRAALDAVRPLLNDTAWAKLARGLNLPPVPGLVAV